MKTAIADASKFRSLDVKHIRPPTEQMTNAPTILPTAQPARWQPPKLDAFSTPSLGQPNRPIPLPFVFNPTTGVRIFVEREKKDAREIRVLKARRFDLQAAEFVRDYVLYETIGTDDVDGPPWYAFDYPLRAALSPTIGLLAVQDPQFAGRVDWFDESGKRIRGAQLTKPGLPIDWMEFADDVRLAVLAEGR